MLIRSFDLECTGIPTHEVTHAVCEVGYADVYQVGKSWTFGAPTSTLCNPGRKIPIEAMAVHHITDKDVEHAISIDIAFRQLVKGDHEYYCAHNADFEREFFGNKETKILCTYKIALRLWPEAEQHNLQYLRYYLNLSLQNDMALPAHRAGPDAYVGAALMAAILNHSQCPDFDTMLRWSKGAALLPRITFGKHRGASWSEVPIDYLSWIVDKSDMDRDIKANARHHIKLRSKNV